MKNPIITLSGYKQIFYNIFFLQCQTTYNQSNLHFKMFSLKKNAATLYLPNQWYK